MKSSNNYKLCFIFLLSAIVLFAPDVAHAGSGGAELDDIWNLIKDWSEGTLGKIISGAIGLSGVLGSVVKQNLWPFVIGIGASVGFANFPTVIEGINSATVVDAASGAIEAMNWVTLLQSGM